MGGGTGACRRSLFLLGYLQAAPATLLFLPSLRITTPTTATPAHLVDIAASSGGAVRRNNLYHRGLVAADGRTMGRGTAYCACQPFYHLPTFANAIQTRKAVLCHGMWRKFGSAYRDWPCIFLSGSGRHARKNAAARGATCRARLPLWRSTAALPPRTFAAPRAPVQRYARDAPL